MDAEAAAVRRAGLKVAAAQRHALAHADESLSQRTVAALSGDQTLPGVRDVEFEPVLRPAQLHLRTGTVAGVLQRVGERLLNDAVRREVAAHRERERLADV